MSNFISKGSSIIYIKIKNPQAKKVVKIQLKNTTNSTKLSIKQNNNHKNGEKLHHKT